MNSRPQPRRYVPSNAYRRFATPFVLVASALFFAVQIPGEANAQAATMMNGTRQPSQSSQTQNRQPANPSQGQTSGSGAQQAPTAGQAAPAGASQVSPAAQDPSWPVNNEASPATVVWDSHGLRINANNSSLDQILHDVAADTGATVDGMSQDERIFGDYGPGPARDVLSQILEGSGYNMIMVGDLGEGAPRQILLSTRTKGGSLSAGAKNRSDDEAEEEASEPEPPPEPVQEQPQPQPQPVANPFGGGAPPRSPQEIMQQMQQRQQQLQQQQQIMQQQQQQQ